MYFTLSFAAPFKRTYVRAQEQEQRLYSESRVPPHGWQRGGHSALFISHTSVVGVVLLLVLRLKEQSAMNERGAADDVGIAVAVRATTKGMGIIVWNLKCQQMCKSIFNLPL